MLTATEFLDIKNAVIRWFSEASNHDQQVFINCPKNELVQFVHTLGRDIRNEFGLWNKPWTPELVGGVDVSPNHPDFVSMTIIEAVWESLQNHRPKSLQDSFDGWIIDQMDAGLSTLEVDQMREAYIAGAAEMAIRQYNAAAAARGVIGQRAAGEHADDYIRRLEATLNGVTYD
mgnify:CR=1 FL=1